MSLTIKHLKGCTHIYDEANSKFVKVTRKNVVSAMKSANTSAEKDAFLTKAELLSLHKIRSASE